jgi:hypothetical protein
MSLLTRRWCDGGEPASVIPMPLGTGRIPANSEKHPHAFWAADADYRARRRLPGRRRDAWASAMRCRHDGRVLCTER